MSGPTEIVNGPKEAYELSLLAGEGHERALEAACSVAVKDSERDLIEQSAMAAGEYIDDLERTVAEKGDDAPPDLLLDYRDALLWFAEKLLKDLPERSSTTAYAPADGEFVQVSVTGDVAVQQQDCQHCKKPAAVGWTVESAEGVVYQFDMNSDVQVRRIATPSKKG